MSRLDPNSDLGTKEILVNIRNEVDFQNACSTSKYMSSLCKHADVLQRRLELYYPQFLDIQKYLKLTPENAYVYASILMYVIRHLSDEKDYPQLTKMWEKLVSANVNYYVLWNIITVESIKKHSYDDIVKYLLVHNRTQEYENFVAKTPYINLQDKVEDGYIKYGRPQHLFQYYKNNNRNTYYVLQKYTVAVWDNYSKVNRQQYLEEYKQMFGKVEDIVLIDLEFGYSDSANKYNVSADTITKRLVRINLLLNNRLGISPVIAYSFENIANVVAYMLSQSMLPNIEMLMPTTKNCNTVIEVIREMLPKETREDAQEMYIDLIHTYLKNVQKTLKMFSAGGIIPNQNMWTEVENSVVYDALMDQYGKPLLNLKNYLDTLY